MSGWEVFECPRCGATQGFGGDGATTKPPTCGWGHAPAEMEQRFTDAMPPELLHRAENEPDFRIGEK